MDGGKYQILPLDGGILGFGNFECIGGNVDNRAAVRTWSLHTGKACADSESFQTAGTDDINEHSSFIAQIEWKYHNVTQGEYKNSGNYSEVCAFVFLVTVHVFS